MDEIWRFWNWPITLGNLSMIYRCIWKTFIIQILTDVQHLHKIPEQNKTKQKKKKKKKTKKDNRHAYIQCDRVGKLKIERRKKAKVSNNDKLRTQHVTHSHRTSIECMRGMHMNYGFLLPCTRDGEKKFILSTLFFSYIHLYAILKIKPVMAIGRCNRCRGRSSHFSLNSFSLFLPFHFIFYLHFHVLCILKVKSNSIAFKAGLVPSCERGTEKKRITIHSDAYTDIFLAFWVPIFFVFAWSAIKCFRRHFSDYFLIYINVNVIGIKIDKYWMGFLWRLHLYWNSCR